MNGEVAYPPWATSNFEPRGQVGFEPESEQLSDLRIVGVEPGVQYYQRAEDWLPSLDTFRTYAA
jgi:hypothetical protein